MAQTSDEILAQYQQPVDAAAAQFSSAGQQLAQAQAELDAISSAVIPGADVLGSAEAAQQLARKDQRATAQQRVDTLTKAYGDAGQKYTDVLCMRADAVTKGKADADPTQKRILEAQALADEAKAKQVDAQTREYTGAEATQGRRDALKADTRLKTAQADAAVAALAVEKELDPVKKAQAQAALDQANATTERIRKETEQIGKPAPRTPEQQRTEAAQATTAEAVATTAPDAAQANLRTAQAQADTAEQNLADAKRRAAQAPTDAQAQQAIQQALDSAQQQYDQAQFNLDQARKASPIALAQGQANVEATQAGTEATRQRTEAGRLGTLYGLQDRIKQLRDLIAAGEIKPEEGDAMIAAEQRGTTVYDAMKQQQQDRAAARTQDTSNLNSLSGDFTSMANSDFTTLADMNKYAQIGSTGMADAYLAMLNIAQAYQQPYRLPPAQLPDYLGPGSPAGNLANTAAARVGAGPPPAPASPAPMTPSTYGTGITGPSTSPSAGGSGGGGGQYGGVTINIGGGATMPTTPAPPAFAQSGMSEGRSAPTSDLIGAAAQSTPAGPQDVIAQYPDAARRHGLM